MLNILHSWYLQLDRNALLLADLQGMNSTLPADLQEALLLPDLQSMHTACDGNGAPELLHMLPHGHEQGVSSQPAQQRCFCGLPTCRSKLSTCSGHQQALQLLREGFWVAC